MPFEADGNRTTSSRGADYDQAATDPERARRQGEAEELAKTIRRLLYLLLFAGFYLVLTLAVDDWELVRADAEIAWAIAGQAAGVDVELSTFLRFAPLVLIALLVYFHLFVGQLSAMERTGTFASETYVFAMRKRSAQIVSDVLLYAFVPAVLAWFTWKTLFRSEALFLALTTTVTALACSGLYYWRAKARNDRVRERTGLAAIGMVAVITLATGGVLSLKGREPFLEWRRIDLVRAPLGATDGRAADLRGLDLRHADARHAKLDGADLRNALLDYADLTDALLSGADLNRASLAGAKLVAADLSGASLVDADLTEADLHDATLETANLSEATLVSATLTAIKGKGAVFNQAVLNGADLTKAQLPAAIFDRASLTDANLTLAELEQTRLGGADLTGVQLEDAKVTGSLFTNAILYDANFRYVEDFETNHFTGAKFCRTAVPPEGKLRNDHCPEAAIAAP